MTIEEQQQIARTAVNRVAAARGLDAPWPDEDVTLPGWVAAELDGADLAAWGAAELGAIREGLASDEDRQSAGIWYTPPELAAGIARFALSITSYPAGYDAPGYTLRILTLDPACGAGVFLTAAARDIAARYAAAYTGIDPAPAWAVHAVMPTVLTQCVFGVDLDPVAVDLARAACWLETGGAADPRFMDDNIIVGDPLADEIPKRLSDRLDTDPDPLYILGNPPYRDKAKGAAPWIEERRAKGREEIVPRPSLDEFRVEGQGRIEYALSNLATFFWRWAVWKALESRDFAGTVAFISPSAYLSSEAYAGMRRHLRAVAREGWVIDLTPEGRQPPKETRLFPDVQTPLAVGIFTTHFRAARAGEEPRSEPPREPGTSQEACAAADPAKVRRRIVACAAARMTVDQIVADTGWSRAAVLEALAGAGAGP
jgi:hypothetical protein